MTASRRPGDGREEAAARAVALDRSAPYGPQIEDYEAGSAALAAADLWDRENGFVRVKLDEAVAEALADAVANAVADVLRRLREAAEQ